MRTRFKRNVQSVLKPVIMGVGIVAVVWLHSGCAELVVPGTLAGAGEWYRYATGNIAKKTYVGNLSEVAAATEVTLQKMNIELAETLQEGEDLLLHAGTADMEISIRLQPVTETAIRVSVDTKKNRWIKDKATANEILSQIGRHLQTDDSPVKPHYSLLVKNECNRPIQVAVYYLAGPQKTESWGAQGWFHILPNDNKQVADTRNRYVYLYAESGGSRKLIWNGGELHQFKGKTYGFFKVDLGIELTDFTQTFTCDP